MNIAVLIKQVPRTDKIKIDKEKGTLIRKGVESILNPYCEYALEAALSIKKQLKNTKITVITMGPPSAKAVIERAVALGADEGIILSDRAFAGSDCRATAYAISCGIKKALGNPEIILCGRQAIDGDTAQVPGETAQMLGIPMIPYITEIVEISDKSLTVKSEFDNKELTLSAEFPVLLTVRKGSNNRRMPSLTDAIRAFSYEPEIMSAKDAGCETEKLGLSGSPTRVVKIVPVAAKGNCRFFNSGNCAEGFAEIGKVLEKVVSSN
ncbi:electron transfer flavoprotein subunit beta/FixA family protein [bacterium]|nr:electron transfer flavoprotein subunit beta/FixA family protein [bacterium]